jgi:hypothetical protein
LSMGVVAWVRCFFVLIPDRNDPDSLLLARDAWQVV